MSFRRDVFMSSSKSKIKLVPLATVNFHWEAVKAQGTTDAFLMCTDWNPQEQRARTLQGAHWCSVSPANEQAPVLGVDSLQICTGGNKEIPFENALRRPAENNINVFIASLFSTLQHTDAYCSCHRRVGWWRERIKRHLYRSPILSLAEYLFKVIWFQETDCFFLAFLLFLRYNWHITLYSF